MHPFPKLENLVIMAFHIGIYSAAEMNLDTYEIMSCEPLHDICNFVQNIITELPYHVANRQATTELEKFCSSTI